MNISGRQGGTSLTTLENLTAGASVWGLLASGVATVESVQWIGERAVKVVFYDSEGRQNAASAGLIDPTRAEPGMLAKRGRPVVVVMAVEEYERLKTLDLSATTLAAKRGATK